MLLRPLFLMVWFLSLLQLSQNTSAQQTPEIGRATLYTYGDLLRKHNIELTEAALHSALKSSDADVRYLAAMKLAEDKATDAIPAIEEALTAERAPRNRVNIALALGLLGVRAGYIELKKVCGDRTFVSEFRLYAVRYMLDLNSPDAAECLPAAEEIEESRDADLGDRISALSLLPRFQNLAGEESQRIFDLVLKSLGSPEPVVQIAASDALSTIGGADAVAHLKAAVANEKDENVRAVFERALARLQKDAVQ